MAQAGGSGILVLGSGGRLGRLLRAAFLRDGAGGHDVTFQSRGTTGDIRWSPGDDLTALPACDTVLALWGRTTGDASDLQTNVHLVDQGAEVAAACGARRLVHLSSAAVYGPGRALHESADLAAHGAYGQSKIAMEARIAQRRDCDTGVAHCILRLANVVGADSLAPALSDGTGPATLHRFRDGDGPRRSYIAASDVLRLVVGLAQLPVERTPDILNAAAAKTVGMADLLKAAGRPIEWHPAPSDAIQDVTLDAGTLHDLLPRTVILNEATDLMRDLRDLEARA